MKCNSCKEADSIPGDCHISCKNPPKNKSQIGSGGDERYKIAEDLAEKEKSVVRCIWPGSGWFPLSFDGNTVFGCCNYKPKGE